MSVASYLKKHTEALVKDVGIEAACEITGGTKPLRDIGACGRRSALNSALRFV